MGLQKGALENKKLGKQEFIKRSQTISLHTRLPDELESNP